MNTGIIAAANVALRAFNLLDVEAAPTLLDPPELFRAQSFTSPKARQEFTAGRTALKLMVAELLCVDASTLRSNFSCPDCTTSAQASHGRPAYLVDGRSPEMSLSFSRSGGWAVAAMVPKADVLLGVDVAFEGQFRFDGFDDVALTPREKLLLAGVGPGAKAAWQAEMWAKKEALAKADGRGLRIDPATIEVLAHSAQVLDKDPRELGLPTDYSVAVAVLDKPLDLN